MTEAETIAKGLTEAQRELLLKLPQRPSLINGAPGRALYRKGLATITQVGGRLVGTARGLAVRDLLTRKEAS